MRKLDEIALYAAMKWDRDNCHQYDCTSLTIIAADLGVPYKRAHVLAEKWASKGWLDVGVSVRYGWFNATAPSALLPWGVVA